MLPGMCDRSAVSKILKLIINGLNGRGNSKQFDLNRDLLLS